MTDNPLGNVTIQPLTGLEMKITGGHFELWQSGNFAMKWFADAKKEAGNSDDHSRRREIMFAVCAVESYLVEWVRDQVLKGGLRTLSHYFPIDPKRRLLGIVERWREVVEHLHEDGSIGAVPDFGEHYWRDFQLLVDFRNGIVHGRASRPGTEGLPEKAKPEPTVEQLQENGSGWAVGVARDVIKKLHEAIGTAAPEWLQQ